MRYGSSSATDDDLARRLRDLLGKDPTEADLADAGALDGDDLPGEEAEEIESEVADAATAARTIAELDKELALLADLIELARRVRHSGTDKKWTELRELLTDNTMITGEKIIIFTEHRDTLEYLTERIRDLLGRSDAVVTIHGGVRRDERAKRKELFTQDIDTRVLVATDAAGEGLNLQRAHLMVNYDLPWNPNRIEQRFGRIHRIGQTEVCHLWNLVATDTREGAVFAQLLTKIEEQRKAYARQGLRRARRGVRGQPAARPPHPGDPLRQRPQGPRPAQPGHRRDRRRGPGQAHRRTRRALPTCSPSRTWRSGAREWTRRTPAASSRTTSAPSSPRRSRSSAAGCPNARQAATRSGTSPPTSATATARPAPAPRRCSASTSG